MDVSVSALIHENFHDKVDNDMRLTLGVHPDEINDVNDIEAALKKLSHEEVCDGKFL